MENDPELKRFKICMQGDEEIISLLTVMQNNLNKDPRKSYNCVKLIVNIANK